MCKPNFRSYAQTLANYLEGNELTVKKVHVSDSSLTIRIAGESVRIICQKLMSYKDFMTAYQARCENIKEYLDEFCGETREIVCRYVNRNNDGDIDYTFTPGIFIMKAELAPTNADFFDFAHSNCYKPISDSKLKKLETYLLLHGYRKDTTPVSKKDFDNNARESIGDKLVNPDDITRFVNSSRGKITVCRYFDGTTVELHDPVSGWNEIDIAEGAGILWKNDALILIDDIDRECMRNKGYISKTFH